MFEFSRKSQNNPVGTKTEVFLIRPQTEIPCVRTHAKRSLHTVFEFSRKSQNNPVGTKTEVFKLYCIPTKEAEEKEKSIRKRRRRVLLYGWDKTRVAEFQHFHEYAHRKYKETKHISKNTTKHQTAVAAGENVVVKLCSNFSDMRWPAGLGRATLFLLAFLSES